MQIKLLLKTSKTITFQIINDRSVYIDEKVSVYLNNIKILETNTNINTLYDLNPNTEYCAYIKNNEIKSNELIVTTDSVNGILNVRDFGAIGDGKRDETLFLQSAINIAPTGSLVEIPEGIYYTGPLFLKNDITLYIHKKSMLLGLKEREKYPILPEKIMLNNKISYLGSWEGEPLDCFASLITGVNVENVNIIGEGILDGNSSYETWWYKHKIKNISWRPRTIFLTKCKNINMVGLEIKNSPSWTVHPIFSQDMKFIDLKLANPKDSPNTDGINPESCKNVKIIGVKFSVGDDCIAIKSGKGKIGRDIGIPSENIIIDNCHMEFGHGGVVIGSEMSGGIKNVEISHCLFENTDRGLRIKSRRGRGGEISGIYASDVLMNNVLTPFVINDFYFCDPDGHSEHVWSKEKYPITIETPIIKDIHFKNIICKDAAICAGFFYGLPEAKIENLSLNNISVTFSDDYYSDFPAMMEHIEKMNKRGFYFNNIKNLIINNITVNNTNNKEINMENIE